MGSPRLGTGVDGPSTVQWMCVCVTNYIENSLAIYTNWLSYTPCTHIKSLTVN